MGKTLVYLVLACVLGFGVYFFLIRNNDELYQSNEANFSIRDTASIGKIFLVDNDGQSILLQRQPNHSWSLNKEFTAMPIQMLNILTCLKLQTAHSPVSQKDMDRVVKLLAGLATKVEVYDLEGKKIRSFYVAGQGPNYHGSFMIIENAKQPYLVEIPGYDGYLTPRFTTDLNDWRSRMVFDIPTDSLKQVSIHYPLEPLNSFSIQNAVKAPIVTVDEQLKPVLGNLNLNRAKAYLTFFSEINAESYMNGTIGMDSMIRNARIRCNMNIEKKSGQKIYLDIYWIDANDRIVDMSDQTSTDSTHRPMDVERMYAINKNTHDTLLIQARTFEKFFKRSYEFYQDEVAPKPAPKPKPPFR